MQKNKIVKIKSRLMGLQGVDQERSEAIIHALIDIEESLNKIYNKTIPKLLDNRGLDTEAFQDLIWDIREEIRHIDYHIHDSGLMDL